MLATERKPRQLTGHPKPRLSPPTPARSDIDALLAQAKEIGIDFMPWQQTSGRYLEALAPDGRHLYQEVAIVVSRQNGKTEELIPLITKRLRAGRRMMHTAQNRELPREVFGRVADVMLTKYRSELKGKPRFANGQEEMRTRKGGIYRIVAPTRGGARGPSNDDLIIDELREMVDHGFIAAAKPTLTASKDPQTIYLSNAGTEESAVLNALRARRDDDPSLAYLEWSAEPGRATDDPVGWCQSNPAIGHLPGVLETLHREHRAHSLSGTMAIYETEHLCRWVQSIAPRVVEEVDWLARKGITGPPVRPCLAISLDPTGKRASAAIAWPLGPNMVALRIEADVTGSPVDTERLGEELQRRRLKLGAARIAFDDRTDKDLARWLKRAKAIGGNEFAAACDKFDRLVRSGALVWEGAEAVTIDLRWLARKATDTGAWQAVRVDDEHEVTAALAAIRAVWLASEPRPNSPRVL